MEPLSAKAKDIFLEAVEIGSPPLRSAFLDRACLGDDELRSRIEALIAAHERPESLLDRAAIGPGPTPDAFAATPDTCRLAEGPGTLIGPYKLLEQIGVGGMGVVYLAEQTQPVRRRVALKLIKPGMDSRQVVARFEAERQALALMDDPHIAKIFDGGVTESGRPYFVMELVKGLPITEYCDRNRLTPRQRLELFVPVCKAVQHAHQKGIIHRDLKPSNVLVSMRDATPVVKVIDFGVAKALGQELTDTTLFTGFAQMIGTPLYMSPEQAGQSALDTDTRSDIYTLGVLLYELLTGTTPFDKERFRKAAYDEIRRIVREEEPPTPSTRLSESGESLASISAQRHMEPVKLRNLVRGELDWIVMKTLEKDRTRRYETANGLAADILRYLSDEPVLACPPSAGYRLRKFAARNKGPVLTGLALAALLVLGIIGTSVGLARAWIAERTANRSAAAETRQRLRAEAAYAAEAEQRRHARKAVDEMYTQVAQQWLAQQPRMEKVQREFLEKALAYYQEFANEQNPDPAARFEVAKANRRLGSMYEKLGRHSESEQAYGQAIAQLVTLTTESPGIRQWRAELAKNYSELAHLQMYTNRVDAAEKLLGKALLIHEQLIEEFGSDAVLRRDVAGDHHQLGVALSGFLGGTRLPQEAMESYDRAIRLYEGLVGDSPDVADNQSALGAALSDRSIVMLEAGELAKAGPGLEQAIRHQQAALSIKPREPTYRLFLVNHLLNWSDVAARQGDHAEAVNAAHQALAAQAKLVEDFPEIPNYRHALAEHSYYLGKLLEDDDPREAEAPLRQAVSLLERLSDTFDKVPERRGLLADCHRELGLVLDAEGQDLDAVAQFQAALKWQPKHFGALTGLGWNLLNQEKFADAEPLLREALTIGEHERPDDWSTFDTQSLLGGALLGQNKYALAEPHLLAGYEGMKQREDKIIERAQVRLACALERLVQLYEGWDQPDKAAHWRARQKEPAPDNKN